MSEQPADESVEVPSDTGADAPDPSKSDDSGGSSDSGSSDTGSSDTGSSDSDSSEPGGVSDAELPEDLQATEDNPLARHPKQTGDEDDQIGADSETGNAADPSAAMTYGEDSDGDSTDGRKGDSEKGDSEKGDSADEDS